MEQVTAFLDGTKIAAGSPAEVTRRIEEAYPGDHGVVLVFDDQTGRPVDLDLWDAAGTGERQAAAPRSRGRPKLGVQAREVTLLPRHWEWLAQRGGASAALRRLVEEAMRGGRSERERREAAYRFMQAACGNRPFYEEALRALYRGDAEGLAAHTAEWPEDLRGYLSRLLESGG